MIYKIQSANLFLILFLNITIFKINAIAQSPNYTIESFQGTYSELIEYESIAFLTEWDPLWSYEFQLNFPFPFYDSTYTRLFFDRSGWGYFTEEQDLSLSLMQYYSWTYDPWMGNLNPDSDARFSHVVSDDLQALVIQFTKARIFADLFEDSLDTYLNFQVWLYENGIIEVRFGEIHMDDNPIYKPGEGMYCFTTSEGIDTNEICGPLMSIADPFDEFDAIGLDGAYNDYEVVGSIYSYLTVMPPYGWVIRFKPISVATSYPVRDMNEIIITPNPVSDLIYFTPSNGEVIVIDASGRKVIHKFVFEGSLDISSLSKGMYTLQVISEDSISFGKFVKL